VSESTRPATIEDNESVVIFFFLRRSDILYITHETKNTKSKSNKNKTLQLLGFSFASLYPLMEGLRFAITERTFADWIALEW
jgi:hypothetical protein